jgi:O-antigen ligase
VEGPAVADLGAVLGAVGVALALLPRARFALLAGLAVLAAGEMALVASLVEGDEARALVASSARIVLMLLGVAVLVGAAALFARYPAVVPVALLLVAPFRIPVDVGDDEAFLLIPLYACLASAGLALAYRAARRESVPPLPRTLAIPTALFVGLAAVSLLWSQDVRSGTIKLAFFLLPFAFLVAVLARTPFRNWLPRALAAALVSLTSAFALLGLWQLATGELPFARTQEISNANAGFFRVTAVFNDPSIYGRHLAVAIVVVLVALWLERVSLRLGVGLITLLSVGLFFAYSQSSLVALFVGVLATTLIAADARSRKMIIGASALLALAAAVLVVAMSKDDSLRRVTSGRSDLVANTTSVILDYPLAGVGIGAEREASRKQAESEGRRLGKASHTAVLTVAAELGAVGLAVLVVFAGGALALFGAARARDEALGLGLGAVFLVIFVHSIFYSGFFEDSLVWGTMGVAAAARVPRRPVLDLPRPAPTSKAVRAKPVAAPRESSTA